MRSWPENNARLCTTHAENLYRVSSIRKVRVVAGSFGIRELHCMVIALLNILVRGRADIPEDRRHKAEV